MLRAVFAAVTVAAISLPVLASDFTAKPKHVGDGDTIMISLRAKGIDAPELRQQCEDAARLCYPCGRVAKDALEGLVGGAKVSIKVWETDRYGRPVVTLYAEGKDVHLEMVRQGQAVVYERYLAKELRVSYLAAEAEAKAAKRGIWAGQFVEPSKWRRGERLICEK
jgi:micrococcal nuclease